MLFALYSLLPSINSFYTVSATTTGSAVGTLYPTKPPQQQIRKLMMTAAYPILHRVGSTNLQSVPRFHNEKAPTTPQIKINRLETANTNLAQFPPLPFVTRQKEHCMERCGMKKERIRTTRMPCGGTEVNQC